VWGGNVYTISFHHVAINIHSDISIFTQVLDIGLVSIPVYWQEKPLCCGFSTTSHPGPEQTEKINTGRDAFAMLLPLSTSGKFCKGPKVLQE
jgi:hypothetical protein